MLFDTNSVRTARCQLKSPAANMPKQGQIQQLRIGAHLRVPLYILELTYILA